jgi:hypothetical protein
MQTARRGRRTSRSASHGRLPEWGQDRRGETRPARTLLGGETSVVPSPTAMRRFDRACPAENEEKCYFRCNG